MPSTSKKQHNFMAAIAKNPAFAKKVGIKQSVGEDFLKADKGRKFGLGGSATVTRGGKGQINKQGTRAGSIYGEQKEVPNVNLNSYIGKKKGGKIMAMQRQRGVKTDEPFNPKNVEDGMKKGGMAKDMESKSEMKREEAADKKQDVAMIKKAFKEHDAQEHKGGKGTKITLKKGGMAMKKMAKGGETMGPRNMSQDVEKGSNKLTKFGESAVQKRGHTKGKNLGDAQMATVGPKEMGAMKKGGKVKKMAMGGSASARADGCAVKGKTKGKMMCMGGSAYGKKK